ncbi:MAG: glycosyltransferase [Anaerosomatales bacterium]|nr:glycosyltransferase [Anaerosomatales bacterium]
MIPAGPQASQLVSVVIPAYGAEDYIEEAIASVRLQDHRPIEVVVVEDASPDRTAAVVQELSDRWRDASFQVRLLRQPQNMGGAAALARGFDMARGEYLCWLSADDAYVDPGYLTNQLAMLRSGADLAYARSFIRGPGSSDPSSNELVVAHWHRRLPWLDAILLRWAWGRLVALLFRVPINGSTVVIRRSAWKRMGNFDQILGNIDQDSDLWLRYSALGARFAMTSQGPAALYRMHAGQTSHQHTACLLGASATRIRIVMALEDVGLLRELLNRAWPILALAWRAGWYRVRPLTAAYLCAAAQRVGPHIVVRYWVQRINASLREEGLVDDAMYDRAVADAREWYESPEFARFRSRLEA